MHSVVNRGNGLTLQNGDLVKVFLDDTVGLPSMLKNDCQIFAGKEMLIGIVTCDPKDKDAICILIGSEIYDALRRPRGRPHSTEYALKHRRDKHPFAIVTVTKTILCGSWEN